MPFTEFWLTVGLVLSVALAYWLKSAVGVMAVGVFGMFAGSVVQVFTTGLVSQAGAALGVASVGVFLGGAIYGLLKLFFKALTEEDLWVLRL
jgi:hypothetical protein